MLQLTDSEDEQFDHFDSGYYGGEILSFFVYHSRSYLYCDDEILRRKLHLRQFDLATGVILRGYWFSRREFVEVD